MLHGSGIEQVSSINDHGHVHVVVQSDPIQFPVFRPFCEQQQGVRMMSGTVRALSSSLVIGHWSLVVGIEWANGKDHRATGFNSSSNITAPWFSCALVLGDHGVDQR